MASNLKVDIIKPTATNGSLSLKGDSSGSATTNGISVDSSGDTLITGDVGIKISSPTSTLHVKSTSTDDAFNDAINVTPSSGITQGGTIGSRTASANARQGLFIKSSQTLTLWGDSAGDGGKVLSVVHGANPSATDDTDEILELTAGGGLSVTGSISIDNLRLDGNTISSTDTNGDINLTPNGSGDVVIDSNIISPSLTGQVSFFSGSSAPTGWLKANGATISRTTYSSLFDVIGTTFGVGDGSTTFELPDLRGEFIRGWDDSRGVDSGRSFGSAQSDDLKLHNHSTRWWPNGPNYNISYPGLPGHSSGSISNSTHVNQSTGGDETRPRNVALLACIKY